MMMVNPEVYVSSPNRMEPHATQSAVEVVANFIEKIPEMNVKFEADTFSLRTSISTTIADSAQAEIDFTIEMVELSKLVIEDLKSNGYASAKAELLEMDVDPGMYRAAGHGQVTRHALYTVNAVFSLTV